MKKRLFLGAFVLLLATTAFFTNTQNSKITNVSLSDIISANIANAEDWHYIGGCKKKDNRACLSGNQTFSGCDETMWSATCRSDGK